MSTNDRPFTAEDGVLFAEIPGNEPKGEPKPTDDDAKPAEELGFLDLVFGDVDENGQPIPDSDPTGRLA